MGDETTASDAVGAASAREAYTFRANPIVESRLATRSAAAEAAFFLPYLRPGMRLLDCGSGPGSITCDLAAVVAPGEVVGLDIQEAQVERARTLARERGISNVAFEVGSIYALPFADNSYDAVFAHMVLMHLRDPLAALQEMRRVLKPDGVAGIADFDWGLGCRVPSSPLLDALTDLQLRVRRHNGASPFYARHQRELLYEAGFVRSEASAVFDGEGDGALAKTRVRAAFHLTMFRSVKETVLDQGWATEAEFAAMEAELLAWGERPDAFYLLARCMAVGWNGDAV
jgi:SAM-dependent methyltransferase